MAICEDRQTRSQVFGEQPASDADHAPKLPLARCRSRLKSVGQLSAATADFLHKTTRGADISRLFCRVARVNTGPNLTLWWARWIAVRSAGSGVRNLGAAGPTSGRRAASNRQKRRCRPGCRGSWRVAQRVSGRQRYRDSWVDFEDRFHLLGDRQLGDGNGVAVDDAA